VALTRRSGGGQRLADSPHPAARHILKFAQFTWHRTFVRDIGTRNASIPPSMTPNPVVLGTYSPVATKGGSVPGWTDVVTLLGRSVAESRAGRRIRHDINDLRFVRVGKGRPFPIGFVPPARSYWAWRNPTLT
jgi:hypothetical protein